MLLLILIFCFLFSGTTFAQIFISSKLDYCVSIKKPSPNYYWRKFEGDIPSDALVGGRTSSGDVTYIGQVLTTSSKRNALLPGTIHKGSNEVEVPFYGVYRGAAYAFILCSDTSERLRWKKINTQDVRTIKESIIVGGFEVDTTVFIGRVLYLNDLIVGKVFLGETPTIHIVTPDNPITREKTNYI